jgi:hypothetical protein
MCMLNNSQVTDNEFIAKQMYFQMFIVHFSSNILQHLKRCCWFPTFGDEGDTGTEHSC